MVGSLISFLPTRGARLDIFSQSWMQRVPTLSVVFSWRRRFFAGISLGSISGLTGVSFARLVAGARDALVALLASVAKASEIPMGLLR